jgi:diaminopimelate epimerase
MPIDKAMIEFTKMHGCGNDFIIIDARNQDVSGFLADTGAISEVCDRHFGVGCDQLIVLENSSKADVEMVIRNADSSPAGMCGNAARCVGALLMKEKNQDNIMISVGDRILSCFANGNLITVDMGKPASSGTVDVKIDKLPTATTVDVGNPHAVFFVANADKIDLASIGPQIENHKLFPDRTNVEFVSKEGEDVLRMRVWERGAGVTLACGSGACATAYAAFTQGISPRKTRIRMDGGTLSMEIREGDGHILMSGPVASVFKGNF